MTLTLFIAILIFITFLENVILRTPGIYSDILLIDFGFAKTLDPDDMYDEIAGTLVYMAPELFA